MRQATKGPDKGGNLTGIRSIALIAVGSNQPTGENDVRETVTAVLQRLADEPVVIRATSRLYQTPAFPPGSGPDFVNAAVAVETDWSAYVLLKRLHMIEAEFGRERTQRWGQRTVDLDLIAMGDLVLPNPEMQGKWRDLDLERQMQDAPEELILPHPRLQERAFVLVPLADVAPDWRHPLLGMSVLDMLEAVPESEKEAVKPLVNPANRA